MVPSHYLNQCCNIVNWTLRNKLQWNFNRNSNIFIEENTFENVICEKLSISSGPQYVNVNNIICWFAIRLCCSACCEYFGKICDDTPGLPAGTTQYWLVWTQHLLLACHEAMLVMPSLLWVWFPLQRNLLISWHGWHTWKNPYGICYRNPVEIAVYIEWNLCKKAASQSGLRCEVVFHERCII